MRVLRAVPAVADGDAWNDRHGDDQCLRCGGRYSYARGTDGQSRGREADALAESGRARFGPGKPGDADLYGDRTGGTLDSGVLAMPTISSTQSGLALANDTCTTKTLAPAQTCTYDVVFTPPAPGDGGIVGTFTGSTSVTDNVATGTATFNGSYF